MPYQTFSEWREQHTALDVPTLTVDAIAKKHKVPVAMIQQQLKTGIRVEMEHTTDPAVAREIALDHLAELPDYYDRITAAGA